MKILVAEDSKTNMAIISASLKELGHEVISANDGQQAITLFKEHYPDLIILDVVMEGMDGFECARKIREIRQDQWIPIIFLSASVDDESISKGIDAGGDDYLTKPFSHIKLAAKIKAMQRISDMQKKLYELTKKLSILSTTDTLTGAYNRLQFDRDLDNRMVKVDNDGGSIALLFIDLNDFKIINDTFGHHIGDLLLIEVTKRLTLCLKENDFIARIGGDEFAVIINFDNNELSNEALTKQLTQNIINVLSDHFNLDGQHLKMSASIGIAFYPSEGVSHDNLVKKADIAMYRFKERHKEIISKTKDTEDLFKI